MESQDISAELPCTSEQQSNVAASSSLLEPDFDLANDEFNKGSYEKCLETLKQLELASSSTSARKLHQHNRAVVEFYKSDCKDHASLLKTLNELDTGESATLTYNKALIYFHRHMPSAAIATLSPLVEKLDAYKVSTSAVFGLLMLRLLLATNQLQKAEAFLELMQIQLGLTPEALTSDLSTSPDASLARVEGLSHAFKLLSMLTNVLNRIVIVIPEDESAEFAALKAHQYYIMKDFQMASKQLKKISTESYMGGTHSDELNTCIANNMGVIHLRVRHYAIAAKFFQNAITFDKQIAANLRNVALHNMSAARSCEILYNLGIAMLHLRRPQEAFQCLLVPLKAYHSNPRLWFRLSEACIMDHEILIQKQEKNPMAQPSVTASGERRFLKHTSRVSYSSNSQSAAVPEPTLEFAALSLRNALTLTNFYSKSFYEPNIDGAGVERENQSWQQVKDNNFCNPSKPISKKSLDNMLAAIYAAYSYVSLRLGDYAQALEMAKELLKSDKVSDAHKMLGHMYAGEALIMMERLAEARPHLEPTFVSSLNAFDFETKDWQVKSLDAAQNIVRYNLAVAMTLQGDFDMARSLLSTCNHLIVATKTKSLKIYLDIKTSTRR